MATKKNSANKPANPVRGNVPFAKGDDPRRFKGSPPGAGRPRDEVRASCLLAFDERLPRLQELADSPEESVALKALDMLARHGGLTFTETEAKVELNPAAEVRIYRLPANGRSGEGLEDAPTGNGRRNGGQRG